MSFPSLAEFVLHHATAIAVGLAGASTSAMLAQTASSETAPAIQIGGFASVIGTVLWIVRQQNLQMAQAREDHAKQLEAERAYHREREAARDMVARDDRRELYQRVDARFDSLDEQIAALWRQIAPSGDESVA